MNEGNVFNNDSSPLAAARHLCQEARDVLTSLRGGPPAVARGELAQDLMEMRILVKAQLEQTTSSITRDVSNVINSSAWNSDQKATHQIPPPPFEREAQGLKLPDPQGTAPTPSSDAATTELESVTGQLSSSEEDGVLVQRSDLGLGNPESPMPKSKICSFSPEPPNATKGSDMYGFAPPLLVGGEDVGPFARPFLAVIMDPRAAGPHTLVSLRALFRLLERGSLVVQQPPATSTTTRLTHHSFQVALEPLMRGVLACKFEQTDAGADEAVEMAIADLLALLVQLDSRTPGNRAARNSHACLQPTTLMEAFNTVFVTRNTFVHSPALCYHFEDVLASMVKSVFANVDGDNCSSNAHRESADEITAALILEFLVNQLLHTPLSGVAGSAGASGGAGIGGGNPGDAPTAVANLDEATREAQMAHDATRVLCLRLTRCCLRAGWSSNSPRLRHQPDASVAITSTPPTDQQQGQSMDGDNVNRGGDKSTEMRVENDVYGAHNDNRPSATLLRIIQDDLCLSLLMTGQAIWAYIPGFISIEVLSEICATISTLWDTPCLRRHLICQFETILTGFYQRALVLLRKRKQPADSAMFNANLVFDSELEIILESLVDLLSIPENDTRLDVYHGNQFMGSGEDPTGPSVSALQSIYAMYDCHMRRSDVAEGLMIELCRCCGAMVDDDGNAMLVPSPTLPETHDISWRPVPPYLKELCAEALLGGMRCLFKEASNNSSNRCDDALGEGASTSASKEEAKLDETSASASTSHDSIQSKKLSSREIKSQKRLMCHAAKLFNQKSSKGIAFMVESGLITEPVTPMAVATFLRNGLVVGLDKTAVGQYLGELGKTPVAGKTPPSWERDWFHKEVLSTYCDLFKFESQSLLDGLRMFLAAFRLPGEGQQIDRIVQAFADSCGKHCDEAVRLQLFSDDPKRASDAAFLLAYSIIMLNTDQHNPHIREDKKMSLDAFIRNNTNYGKEITEKGKEFPPDFLTGIYESIQEEEIRTEAEGSEGAMTVERWRDVIRVTNDEPMAAEQATDDEIDLKDLIVENLCMPMLSCVGAFWGFVRLEDVDVEAQPGFDAAAGMLGTQGARLGMDIAIEMLMGLRSLGRVDLFREMFVCVCGYTGLIGEYDTDATQRTLAFVGSVEAQSAVVTAIQAARDAGDDLDVDCWKRLWEVIFELRDLKLLGGGTKSKRHSLLLETEPDLLSEESRREWSMRLVKGDSFFRRDATSESQGSSRGFFGAMGRALFGTTTDTSQSQRNLISEDDLADEEPKSIHGKEKLVLWDELAASDDEDDAIAEEEVGEEVDETALGFVPGARENAGMGRFASPGANFEGQLVQEDLLFNSRRETPITGLERVDDTFPLQISSRARVRKRLAISCDFAGLVSETRFMEMTGIESLLEALVDTITHAAKNTSSSSTPESSEETAFRLPLSPASEAMAEVLICEIAIRNKDRLAFVWDCILKNHYETRLTMLSDVAEMDVTNESARPGTEKCITGLLRICSCAVVRDDVADEVLGSLHLLSSMEENPSSDLNIFDKHIGEGLWRICRNVDGVARLNEKGWMGLLSLSEFCASRGGRAVKPARSWQEGTTSGLTEDDPSLHAFRSLHFIIHAAEVKDTVPFSVAQPIRALIVAGEKGSCAKLCIAGLDLLREVHSLFLLRYVGQADRPSDAILYETWAPLLDGMAEVVQHSANPSIRQHALSTLTDVVVDKSLSVAFPHVVCKTLSEKCVPLVGKRISVLLLDESMMRGCVDEIMIEFEQCIGLIFKPFLSHLQNFVSANADLMSLWTATLAVMEQLLGERLDVVDNQSDDIHPDKLRQTLKELASEHLRNSFMILASHGLIRSSPEAADEFSTESWNSLSRMKFCSSALDDWKECASQQATSQGQE